MNTARPRIAWALCLALACVSGGASPPSALLAIRDVLHDEVSLLVEGGLSAPGALLAATRDPARALDLEDEIGTIRPGLVADLLLLRGDPLEELENTRRIEAVVLRGELLRRSELDSILGR